MVVPALICGIVFASCTNKVTCDNRTYERLYEGKYTGTFTVKYFIEMPQSWVGSGNGKAAIEFKDGKFTSTGNPNRVPAGGSGNYSIDGNKIIFQDENIWTADFDGGLILSGEYDYIFKGKKLKISRKSEHAHYEYNLERK